MIEGQIKELQGVVPNTHQAENDQKRPGRIGLIILTVKVNWRKSIAFCNIELETFFTPVFFHSSVACCLIQALTYLQHIG